MERKAQDFIASAPKIRDARPPICLHERRWGYIGNLIQNICNKSMRQAVARRKKERIANYKPSNLYVQENINSRPERTDTTLNLERTKTSLAIQITALRISRLIEPERTSDADRRAASGNGIF